jgi:hypothetical protein
MKMPSKRLSKFALLISFATFVGCEKPAYYTCMGTITHDGRPVPDLQITFAPVMIDSVRSPMGLTDANGKFEMTTARFRGVPPGKFKVFVEDPRAADGSRTRIDDDYLYVTKRYCELNSDVIYVSDMHRENFELKLDTKDLPQKADPETPPAAATKQETPQTETPPAEQE